MPTKLTVPAVPTVVPSFWNSIPEIIPSKYWPLPRYSVAVITPTTTFGDPVNPSERVDIPDTSA